MKLGEPMRPAAYETKPMDLSFRDSDTLTARSVLSMAAWRHQWALTGSGVKGTRCIEPRTAIGPDGVPARVLEMNFQVVYTGQL